jgi:predicted nucleotidyltransferase component of viral defense system
MSVDLPTEPFDHADHAKHAAHSEDPLLIRVSATIAILAVAAATVGSFETIETANAISEKNQAVIEQNEANDNWNLYQAKSIKKNMYEIAAITNPDRKEEFDKQARRYESEQDEPSNEAKKFTSQSKKSLQNSTAHETRHHHLTIAVTVLHVSIAIATISIIMPKTMRWRHAPWFASLALGAFGAIIAVAAYAR